MSDLHQAFCACYYGRESGVWWRCDMLCTSRFTDDVILHTMVRKTLRKRLNKVQHGFNTVTNTQTSPQQGRSLMSTIALLIK